MAVLVMCISAYGPEDDDGRGGSNQHKSNDVSGGGGHTHNHLGANGHGQRGFDGSSHHTTDNHHADGTPCHQDLVGRAQHQGRQHGKNSGEGYS